MKPEFSGIERRLEKLNVCLKKLEPFKSKKKEEILQDPYLQDIIERNLEVSAQSVIDIANRIISIEDLEKPQDYYDAIMRLGEAGIIPLKFAQKLADTFGVKTITENITEALIGFGCYKRRDEAVQQVFPEYDPDRHKMKIGLGNSGLLTNLPPLFSVTIIDKQGNEKSRRLPGKEMRQIVAASNFKQRSRMSMLYYHAELLHYAVVGTPNKHEVEQGFFVKYGDGGADVMPIAHLYKTQVYQLARHLGVPKEIIDRTPTTDTYSAEQTQEEFYYQLPFHQMDLLWYAFENGYDPIEVAPVMKMADHEVKSIFINFNRKKKTTEYLRMKPICHERF